MTKILTTMFACALGFGSLMAGDPPAADKPVAKPYPLDTCIVSGDKLGDMGDVIVIVREGQEIKLCCKGCIKDVDKDPAKYLKKIDEAAKAKADGKAKAPAVAVPEAHH